MPHPQKLKDTFDYITAGFTYVRWLGDRKGIEGIMKTWNKVVADGTRNLSGWVDICHEIKKRGVTVYACANNHYAGHAPATIEQFRNLWLAKGLPELDKVRR